MPAIVIVLSVGVSVINAQEPSAYKLVPQTVFEQQPVKVTQWVDETVHETQQVTTYKMVWQTETRERRNVEYKPVRKTVEREKRVVVRKPIVETLFREQRTEETTYDEVTEMRDETYTVRKPVRETRMREEQVTVRQPVTEKLIQVQRTTTYRPVVRTQTMMVPSQAVVQQFQTAIDPTRRARMRRLTPGFYTNPVTGQTEFRRRGLHWVQPTVSVPVASTVPVLVPQQVGQVDFVPETTEQRKPVEITRFVEKVETRKVPIEVERIIEETATRKVPVTVRIPRKKVTIEKVPYTRTTFRDEVTVTKVPHTETTYEKVETIEPYTVEVPRWIPETKEIRVPRKVSKRVEYEEMREVPRTIMMKVPLDACGNPLPGVAPIRSEMPETGTTSSQTTTSSTATKQNYRPDSGNSILSDEKPAEFNSYPGELKLINSKTLDETSERSVVQPDTSVKAERPEMKLKSIVPPAKDSREETDSSQSEAGPKELVGPAVGEERENNGTAQSGLRSEDTPPESNKQLGEKARLPEDNPPKASGDEAAADRP